MHIILPISMGLGVLAFADAAILSKRQSGAQIPSVIGHARTSAFLSASRAFVAATPIANKILCPGVIGTAPTPSQAASDRNRLRGDPDAVAFLEQRQSIRPHQTYRHRHRSATSSQTAEATGGFVSVERRDAAASDGVDSLADSDGTDFLKDASARLGPETAAESSGDDSDSDSDDELNDHMLDREAAEDSEDDWNSDSGDEFDESLSRMYDSSDESDDESDSDSGDEGYENHPVYSAVETGFADGAPAAAPSIVQKSPEITVAKTAASSGFTQTASGKAAAATSANNL